MKSNNEFSKFAAEYLKRLRDAGSLIPLERVEELGHALLDCWKSGNQVFIIGNGVPQETPFTLPMILSTESARR